MKRYFFLFLYLLCQLQAEEVELGVDRFFKEGKIDALKGKRLALVTNHTGMDSALNPTWKLFIEHKEICTLVALFCPEHGLQGLQGAEKHVADSTLAGLPVYSLYGQTRRPTHAMLKDIDVLIYDIQDIGIRSYTYATTLFYVMEEAAKHHIRVIVLDRPNPMGGTLVDGPMLETAWRSFIGYINTPYCHGMTIGELALFFNKEYQIHCDVEVIPMKGWKRQMQFADTGLVWTPTSPQVPEADTPLFQAATGILGELGIVNIGIGYTLPFKVVGAPWIDADKFAKALENQHLAGVRFLPFHYTPFFGLYSKEPCHGVRILITEPQNYSPTAVHSLLVGILKSLYPQEINKRLKSIPATRKELFCKAWGSKTALDTLQTEKHPAWKLIALTRPNDKDIFLAKRKEHLLYSY